MRSSRATCALDGVFAAYDYDWPPLVHWEAGQAFHAFSARVEVRDLEIKERVYALPKHEHLGRIKASGRFRYLRVALLHAHEEGDAARFIGLSMTNRADRLLREGLVKSGALECKQRMALKIKGTGHYYRNGGSTSGKPIRRQSQR